jgi:DNA-directed RNA polymerase specialized sigma24 family protein
MLRSLNGCELLGAFRDVTIRQSEWAVDAFVADVRPVLERALVARHGIPTGADAASDAVEYAYANWQRLATMANPAGYLFRVGDNRALRAARSAGRHVALVAEPLTVDSPYDIDLQRALLRLSWEQRVVVVLVHAHGHSYGDAARIMDLPVTTVTNHLHRGLNRLRRLLEDQ